MDKLEQLLTLDEGNRLSLYQDSVGKWTIGRGHNLSDCGISENISQQLYDEDIAKAQADLTTMFPTWQLLDDVRQAVLLDLTFNLDHRLESFHDMLTALQLGQFGQAANALQNSLWFRQVGVRGPRLVTMLRTGQWPPQVV